VPYPFPLVRARQLTPYSLLLSTSENSTDYREVWIKASLCKLESWIDSKCFCATTLSTSLVADGSLPLPTTLLNLHVKELPLLYIFVEATGSRDDLNTYAMCALAWASGMRTGSLVKGNPNKGISKHKRDSVLHPCQN
jgi:hypothetical protein